jgi:type III pantothenate kinase
MILTVDIGNSRIKFAVWKNDEIVERAAEAYEGHLGEVFGRLKSRIRALSDVFPERVFALCVAGDVVSQQFDDWVRSNWRLTVEYLKTEKRYKKIINAYQDPASHGVDRWAALIAASEDCPGESVCVICSGTAITFDLLKSDGQHLGGYILPSYNSMHAALISDTADIKSDQNDVLIQQRVPDNTDDAVNQGITLLLQSGIRALCLRASQELGDNMRIILTGGSARSILRYPDLLPMEHAPDLIMQGLYEVMSRPRIMEQPRAVSED